MILSDYQTGDRYVKWGYWVFLLAFLYLLIASFSLKMPNSANPLSRLIPIERFLNEGTLSLGGSPYGTTIDVVQIEGKLYSSKPPLLTLLMIDVAWLIKQFTGWDIVERRRAYVWILIMLFNVIPYLAAAFFAYTYSMRFSKSGWARFYLALCLTFGMLPFLYSLTINNHTITSAFVLVSFLLTYHIKYSPESKKKTSAKIPLFAGLLTGMATSFEFTSGVFQAIFIWLIFTKDKKAGILSGAISIIPLLVTFHYYHTIGGSIVPFYMRKELYSYPGSYWLAPRGTDAYSEAKPIYFFHILFGRKGLLLFTPFLAASFYELYRKVFKSKDQDREIYLLSALGIVTVILFIGFYTNNYGGLCIGMRWFILFMPLLTYLGISVYDKILSKRYRVFLIILWLSASMIVIAGTRKNGPWNSDFDLF